MRAMAFPSLAHTVEGACSPYRCQVGGHGRCISAAPILGPVKEFQDTPIVPRGCNQAATWGAKGHLVSLRLHASICSRRTFARRRQGRPCPDKAAGSPMGGAVVGGRGAAAVGAATTPRAIAITAADTELYERCGVHKPVTTAGATNGAAVPLRDCFSSLPQRRRLPCQKQQRRPDRKPGGASVLSLPWEAEADGERKHSVLGGDTGLSAPAAAAAKRALHVAMLLSQSLSPADLRTFSASRRTRCGSFTWPR